METLNQRDPGDETDVVTRDPAPAPTIDLMERLTDSLGTSPLRAQVRRVWQARGQLLVLGRELADAQAQFERDHEELIRLHRAAAERVTTEETSLRGLAIEEFQRTASKTPAPGVGIRMVKQVQFNGAAALAWARERGMALQLDTTAFKKIAIASPDAVPCAKVTEEPQAIIAADLGKVLQ